MNSFLGRCAFFLLLLAAILQIRSLYLLHGNRYQDTIKGRDIYVSLKTSKRKTKARILILGDSVGRQLFPTTQPNPRLHSLACNQAIGLPGHYALLENFYKAGNTADTVILIYHPDSFGNNLDQVYTFHYFVKPLFIPEYRHLWTEDVVAAVHKIPFYWLAHFPPILTSEWAPNYSPSLPKEGGQEAFLSPLSAAYLQKIIDVTAAHGSRFVLIAPPLSERRRTTINSLDTGILDTLGLTPFFSDYFERLTYIPDAEFADGKHLINPAPWREQFLNLPVLQPHAAP